MSTITSPATLPLSQQITAARDQLIAARSAVHAIMYGPHKGWASHVDHVHGLLTCGIVALAHANDEVIAHEVRVLDKERGQSLHFSPRGIGSDSVPACFVCGETSGSGCMDNIAAFVASKEEGERIVAWFRGRARLDYREYEPNRIQVKVGVCKEHREQLEQLFKVTCQYGRIRERDIAELMQGEAVRS